MKSLRFFVAFLMAAVLFATPVFAFVRIVDDVEYAQVREIAQIFDWDIEWDGENQAVILTSPDGSSTFRLGVEESGGFIENGRVYLPSDVLDSIFIFRRMPSDAPVRPSGDYDITGMLTRIEHGDNVAYIIGSLHASLDGFFPLSDMVEEAMTRADVFVFEIDMVELYDMPPELAAQITEVQMLPDGLTLEDILPEEIFRDFMAALDTYSIIGIDYEMISDMTPIAISMMLESIMHMLMGTDITLSVDSYVMDFALENDLPILGLNGIMREFEIVFDMPLEIQAYSLWGFPTFNQMLDSFSNSAIVELYANQDFETIRSMYAIPEGEVLDPYTEIYLHNLLHVRCHIFADGIASLLEETEEPTTFFVTIGLAHILGGGAGLVLELLEERGFELEPLWNQ